MKENNRKDTNMSNNKKKSKRNWQYSGYKECHECKQYHYDTWTSTKPTILRLCKGCYDFIYKHDRQQPTLFDDME